MSSIKKSELDLSSQIDEINIGSYRFRLEERSGGFTCLRVMQIKTLRSILLNFNPDKNLAAMTMVQSDQDMPGKGRRLTHTDYDLETGLPVVSIRYKKFEPHEDKVIVKHDGIGLKKHKFLTVDERNFRSSLNDYHHLPKAQPVLKLTQKLLNSNIRTNLTDATQPLKKKILALVEPALKTVPK
jgi:hypothetical protein